MDVDAEINDFLSKFSEDEKCLLLDLMKKISNDDLNASIAERILAYNMNWKKPFTNKERTFYHS
jgi:hypothetical protein